jgi:hypothetical protein
MDQVIPFCEADIESHSLNVSASISGVRLGGGMNYAEALLHRFGILGPDGGPEKGLSKGLEDLQKGPLAKLFKTTPLIVDNSKDGMRQPHLLKPVYLFDTYSIVYYVCFLVSYLLHKYNFLLTIFCPRK